MLKSDFERISLGVSHYSLLNEWRAGRMPVDRFFEFVRQVGGQSLELLDAFLYPPGSVRDHLPPDDVIKDLLTVAGRGITSTGVRVLAVSVTNDFFHFDEARLQIEAAKVGLGMMLASQLGAPVVRVFAGDPTTEEDTSEVMAISTELLGQLKNERCTLALENHGRAFGNPLNVAEVVTGARIGVCFDIGNYVLAGYDPVHAATLLPFPDLIHVKDFRPDPTGPFASPSGQRLAGCRLGEGVVPIAQTLEVLFNKPEAHPIPVHLELECGDDGAQATVTGMDFMRKVLRQFGS